jgi:flagellar hook-associated protein 2
MEAERKPVNQLQARKTKEETRMKLFQEFKGKFANFDRALAEIGNPTSFKEFKFDLGDAANKLGVTLDKTKVQPGTYEIEVSQLANRSSVVTNGFETADKPVLGTGYVVVYAPSGEKEEIYIGGENASLSGVARAINTKSDGSIRATVMRDDSDPDKPWRLMIASKEEGVEKEVIFPEFYFLDGKEDIYIDTDRESQNAILKLNGYELEAGQNKIPDFLSGVTLDLKQAEEGKPFTLKIGEDIQKMAGKMKGVVDQINGILEFINKQNQVDEKSDTSTSFAGDTSLQSIEYRLRNLFHEGFPVWDNTDDPDILEPNGNRIRQGWEIESLRREVHEGSRKGLQRGRYRNRGRIRICDSGS